MGMHAGSSITETAQLASASIGVVTKVTLSREHVGDGFKCC